MPSPLEPILEATRRRREELRPRRAELEQAAREAPLPPSWEAAFHEPNVTVIAEVKRRSPSRGIIRAELEPAQQARAYLDGGARAVSVLTEGPHFGGSLDDLLAVRQAVPLPVLRKDFILDPLQLFEARAAGASAALLIVRLLNPGLLASLVETARDLHLGLLVEVHTLRELETALHLDPEVIGVNSRDLGTLRVDIDAARAVLRAVPSSAVAVAESGLKTRADVERVAEWGADAVLVGTALSAAADPARSVRALIGVSRRAR